MFLSICVVKFDCVKILELVKKDLNCKLHKQLPKKGLVLDGQMDEWMEVKAGLRIAYSNQQI